MSVHNHRPYRPMCNERLVDGQLRGACLNDDGTARMTTDTSARVAALRSNVVPMRAKTDPSDPTEGDAS